MSNGVTFDWDSNFGLHWLAHLLGDPLGDWNADDILLNVTGSDRHSLGDLLGGVDTHLLGHLTAVRLDGDVGSGNSSWGSDSHSLGDGSGMSNVGGAHSVSGQANGSDTVAQAGSVPGVSL